MTTILTIEDDAAILENILETLEIEGFEVLGAENGRVGLQLAQEHLPDLVLCDIMMPELDGYGVLLALRSEPATATIPVIFLTAKTDRAALRYGMELGADDYIPKPFIPDELITAINTRLERKVAVAREHKAKLDELRGSIVHMLPHELRTPLNGILGYAELLMYVGQNLDNPKVFDMAQNVQRSGRRLHRLIENFLVYAQTEIIRADPERIQVLQCLSITQPRVLIEYAAKQKAQQVNREKDLQLVVSEVARVQIVEDNLTKIVEELVDNAFKFSERGTTVCVATTANDNEYVLSVSNHGRGMTPEQIAQIGAYMQFERKLYEQQGTGLGLILARRLAELHGGALSIESVPGQETTVQVILPVQ